MLSYAFRHWENTPLPYLQLKHTILNWFPPLQPVEARPGKPPTQWSPWQFERQFPRFWPSFMCSSFDFAQNHPNKTSQSNLDYEHLLTSSWCCDFLTISYLEEQGTHIICRQGTVYAEMPLTGLSLARINDRTDVSGAAVTGCRLLQ